MNRSKETYLGNLPDKTKFEIVGLEDSFKNLMVLHSNDCGCLIKGERRAVKAKEEGEQDIFSPIQHSISCGTPVRVIYE